MDLAARCAFLLSSFAVLAALDLDAIDPGYYVETSSSSDVIDYKDPCKAEGSEILTQVRVYQPVIQRMPAWASPAAVCVCPPADVTASHSDPSGSSAVTRTSS
ncbi:hypothetical protein E1301_Tti013391 [Triplophysa tibetana]|uniref:Uncharacterized protein n=1 Tax=Triplophysa tibetana TaxID=1572043 RepID=A0A5A9NV27_9TELE|nr:hypothetical protein E1301_Tti013391 [Triplophysa tibetana]